MDTRKKLLVGGIPLLGGAVFLGALFLRSWTPVGPESNTATSKITLATQRPLKMEWEGKPSVIAQAVPKPVPAPEKTIAARSEDVRVRATYQNYRTAIATNNTPLEQALRPVVLRDRELCLSIAQEELAAAQTEMEREVARKVIERMRR